MIFDATTGTAIASVLVALGTTVVTYLKRTDDGMARRIDQAMDANQELVEDLRSERTELLGRVDALNDRVEALTKEVGRLRDMVSTQARDLFQLRANEAELRYWAEDVAVPWIARALAVIRDLGGGDFDRPPPPPSRHDY